LTTTKTLIYFDDKRILKSPVTNWRYKVFII
jgi:hypothetical protein